MTVNQRIKFLREQKKLTQQSFADAIGVTRANLSQIEIEKQLPTLSQLERIVDVYDVSFDWLMKGRKNIAQQSIVSENAETYLADRREKDTVGRKGIPLVGVEALGGSGNSAMAISESDVLERYSVPDFKDVDFLIPLKGDSMMPSYQSGDLIACRTITDRTFLIWGRAYLIASRSHGIIVKRLFPGTNADHLTCRSDNAAFPDFEIPETDEIHGLALVVGLIRAD